MFSYFPFRFYQFVRGPTGIPNVTMRSRCALTYQKLRAFDFVFVKLSWSAIFHTLSIMVGNLLNCLCGVVNISKIFFNTMQCYLLIFSCIWIIFRPKFEIGQVEKVCIWRRKIWEMFALFVLKIPLFELCLIHQREKCFIP